MIAVHERAIYIHLPIENYTVFRYLERERILQHIVDSTRNLMEGRRCHWNPRARTKALILSPVGIVKNYRREKGYHPHCPRCMSEMVADGKVEKVIIKGFARNARKAFSMTAEGMIFLMAKSITMLLPYLFGAPGRELERLGLIRRSMIERRTDRTH